MRGQRRGSAAGGRWQIGGGASLSPALPPALPPAPRPGGSRVPPPPPPALVAGRRSHGNGCGGAVRGGRGRSRLAARGRRRLVGPGRCYRAPPHPAPPAGNSRPRGRWGGAGRATPPRGRAGLGDAAGPGRRGRAVAERGGGEVAPPLGQHKPELAWRGAGRGGDVRGRGQSQPGLRRRCRRTRRRRRPVAAAACRVHAAASPPSAMARAAPEGSRPPAAQRLPLPLSLPASPGRPPAARLAPLPPGLSCRLGARHVPARARRRRSPGEPLPTEDEGLPTEPAVPNGHLPSALQSPEQAVGAQLRRMGDAFEQAHARQPRDTLWGHFCRFVAQLLDTICNLQDAMMPNQDPN